MGVPQRFDEQLEFGDLSDKALLEHASTLENLRQDGNYLLESSTIQQPLSSAPNLKRFDAMSRNRFLDGDFELKADDIISGEPWDCTKLELLKVRIVGVPCPNITQKRNGEEIWGHLHDETMKKSREIQRGVYEQLGRLTKLR